MSHNLITIDEHWLVAIGPKTISLLHSDCFSPPDLGLVYAVEPAVSALPNYIARTYVPNKKIEGWTWGVCSRCQSEHSDEVLRKFRFILESQQQ